MRPLALDEKASNKRFNKMIDRVVAVSIAFGLAVLAYGGVQEVLSRQAGLEGVRWAVVAGSMSFGLALVVAAIVVGYLVHRRED